MTQVFIGIGSNINPLKNINLALNELTQKFSELIQSPIYQSQAVGFDGDDFYNLVVSFHYPDSLANLLEYLEQLETKIQGQIASALKYRSRRIDLDLLLFGEQIEINEHYEIPRSDILKFAFVLKPLADIAPQLVHPTLQLPIQRIWQNSALKNIPLIKID